jgi:Yip1-like protein
MTDGPTNPTPTPPPGGMPDAPSSLVDRVKNILVSPKTEWPRIDAEPATIGGIYTSYVLILAAIPAIAGLIGQQLMMGIFTPALNYSIGMAVIGYLLSLVAVYVLALIIDVLAPTFGGTKDMVKSFKVAAYAYTPIWVLGILNIVPMLGMIGALAGLAYAAYLLYLGLGVLKNAPADKTVGYTVATIVALIVIYFVIGMIVGILVLSFFGAAIVSAPVVRY